jgi:hypothetical protein
MKNLLLFMCLFLLFCSSCKYFRKSSSKIVDTITADTTPSDTGIIDSAALFSGMDNNISAAATVSTTNAVTGTYYMIVGCFTVPTNADKYAEKVRGMGYQTQIISGIGNYQMVAARSYGNYRESVAELDKFRNEVTPNAWVYLKK